MRQQIIELTEKYKAMGDALCGEITKPIRITFSKRCSRTAGLAYPKEWRISINMPLFELHPEGIEDTVGHEVAHLFNWKIHEAGGHGIGWKNIMYHFGLKPERCHSFAGVEVVGRERTKYVYKCEDCGTEVILGKTRHNRAKKGIADYHHPPCKRKRKRGMLTYVTTSSRKERLQKLIEDGAVQG